MAWANDDLASATALAGSSGSITPLTYDSTVDPATSETGESVYYGGAGETLWWKWTAPTSGDFTFDTLGSPSADADPGGLDTTIQVFSGPSSSPTHAGLTLIDSNNDNAAGDTYVYNSRVTFTATSGTTYYVQVDQFNPGQAGTIHLNWAIYVPPPPAPTATTWATSGTYNVYTAFPGDDVTVTGTDLDAVTTATVGGVTQPFTATSSTSLVIHINGSAVSGPIIVSNISGSAHPTHSGSDLTVLYPGPWVQPADEPAQDDASGIAGYSPSPKLSSASQPDFAGSPSGSAANLAVEVFPTSPQPTPAWTWDGNLPVIAFYPPGSGTMPPYDASPDVAADPHAVTYQLEAGASIPTSDLTLTWRVDIDAAEYLESTNNRTLAEDLWQETVQFRRIPDSDWDSSGFTAGVWPSQAALAALPVDHDQPFRNDGQALVRSSVNGWTDNDAFLDFTVPVTYGDPQTVTFADLGSGRAWVATLSSFVGASSIAVPYMAPSETTGVGNGTGHKILFGIPRVHATWTYRPQRYRLIYDTPPVTTGWQVGSVALS